MSDKPIGRCDPDDYIASEIPKLAALLVTFSNWRWQYREGSPSGCDAASVQFANALAAWRAKNG